MDNDSYLSIAFDKCVNETIERISGMKEKIYNNLIENACMHYQSLEYLNESIHFNQLKEIFNSIKEISLNRKIPSKYFSSKNDKILKLLLDFRNISDMVIEDVLENNDISLNDFKKKIAIDLMEKEFNIELSEIDFDDIQKNEL